MPDAFRTSFGPALRHTKHTAPSFSMSSRQQKLQPSSKGNPGPGAYAASNGVGSRSATRRKATSAPFAKSRRKGLADDTHDGPGPGSYQMPGSNGRQASSVRPSSASVSLGARIKNELKPADLVGPGATYAHFARPSTSPNKVRAPAHSMGARQKVDAPSRAPGVGRYDTKESSVSAQQLSTSASAPAFSMSGRARPRKVRGEHRVFTCREDSAFNPASAGEPQKGYAFTGRGASSIVEHDGPGAGAYGKVDYITVHASSRIPSTSRFTFGAAAQRPRVGGGKASGRDVGPGTYGLRGSCGTQINSSRASSPAYGFGPRPGSSSGGQRRKKGKRRGNESKMGRGMAEPPDNPGPGAYNLKSMVGGHGAPSPSMSSRQNFGSIDFEDRSSPGPAAYGSPAAGKHGFSFGSSARVEAELARHVRENRPGPGQYSGGVAMIKASAPKASFGVRVAMPGMMSSMSSDTVGPGRCRDDSSFTATGGSSIVKTGPSHSFGARTGSAFGAGDGSPGPGAYG